MANDAIHGRRPIPNEIDNIAAKTPTKVYAKIPVDDQDLARGYRDISIKQLANAVNSASFWLDEALGETRSFAYYGARDLRYAAIILAAAKTGRKVLLASLLASLDAHVGLVKCMESEALVYSPEQDTLVRAIAKSVPNIKCITAPSFEDWFKSTGTMPHYAFTKTFAEVENHPVFVVHTSGTTGRPKPVIWTHGHMTAFGCWKDLADVDGTQTYAKQIFHTKHTMYISIPLFHIFAIYFIALITTSSDIVIVLGPSTGPPSAQVTDAILRHAQPDSGIFPPFLIESVARQPETWERFKKMKLVIFGGAPLDPVVGNELAKSTKLWNGIGSTEAGGYPTLAVDPEDWQYFHFHPANGATFEKQGDLDIYELVLQKNPATNQAHCMFRTFPDVQTYRTKDLWIPHPTKPDLWKYSGRTDDLVLLTGEIKLYAQGIEEAVQQHPAVNGVLVGGDCRIEPFMLVELIDSVANNKAMLDDIWNHVEAVNQKNAESARIRRDLTVFATAPFVRTAKDSIDRRGTFSAYQEAVDALYAGRC